MLAQSSRTLLTPLSNVLAAGPCDPPANEIVAENCRTGNPSTEWAISGVGSSSIQGFATDISVNQGDTVTFKVDPNGGAFHLDIYRLGYYAGLGARRVATVPGTAPSTQPNCLTDLTVGLLDCGNWTANASWLVPTDATSGIYFARAVRDTAPTGASHIVFIVRDDDGGSDLLFQTSDTTWQAYSGYGGNSLYMGASTSPPAGRAYKVSYNRPFRTVIDSRPSWLFNAEYPMVRWLEANGYDVSYFTGVDSDCRGGELLEHRAFLSVGHDEYWSAAQRAAVENARNAGVHLGFFSGNEVFWKTRWEASIDGSGTPYRTLVTYKETHANAKIDPNAAWTGTWRDPRFSPPADGGRPENGLTGTIFKVNGTRNDTIRVPSAFAPLRFWRNTSIASLLTGQSALLIPGTLGYEWDEDIDNGFRPAGLTKLSSTTVVISAAEQQYLLDHGNTYGAGTATHSLTLHRHSSGALVFGAGTVQWPWGLDTNHDNGTPPPVPGDPGYPAFVQALHDMQQATMNLFTDMGVQPATPQAGLIVGSASTDTTRPGSTILTPAAGALLDVGSPVVISGTAADGGGGVVAGVEVSTDNGATWHPAIGRESWTYTWTPTVDGTTILRSRASDDSGNVEIPSAGVSVSVRRVCPCSLWSDSTTPALASDPSAGAIELGVRVRADMDGFITGLRFYKGAGNTGVHVGNLWTNTGTLLRSATFTSETASGWQEVRFATAVPIVGGTTYVASYFAPNGHFAVNRDYFLTSDFYSEPLRAMRDTVTDRNGIFRSGSTGFPAETFGSSNYWVDVVFELTAVDTTPPAVNSVSPVANATGVSASANVTVTFNESMDPATITTNTIVLVNGAGSPVPAAMTFNPGTKTATLDPVDPLQGSNTHTATVRGGSAGVKDLAGNALPADFTWSFTTASAAVCPCTIWPDTATPAVAADPFAGGIELGVKWQAEIDGFVTGLRFYKSATNLGPHVGSLWTGTGTLLTSVTFTGGTTSGWQQVMLPTPVPVLANTTYVASYHTPSGHYSVTQSQFALGGVDAAPLHALGNAVSGGNGVFRESATPIFPNQSFASSNYWVDLVFSTTSGPDTTPPTVTAVTPLTGATGVSVGANVVATFSEQMNPATITTTTVELRNASSALVPATVSYNSLNRTATLDPSGPLANLTAYTATVKGGAAGVKDVAGNPLAADVTWSFTTAAAAVCPCTIFPASAIPATPADSFSGGIELGVKWQSEVDGFVTGLRFYKGLTNIGTHIGNLRTSTGTLLSTAIFTGETASGWQEVTLPAPVPVQANTTYVASYHTTTGHFSVTQNMFTAAGVDAPPLHALANGVAGGNGVFIESATPANPTQSFAASNYWVDVVFTMAGNSPPTISDTTDKTTNEDTATAALSFTVGDAETPAASLTLTGGSSNTAVVPAGNIVFGGSGSSRTVTITPAPNQSGSAIITLTVTDGNGGTASDTFVLTVTAVNDVPTISDVTDKTTPQNTASGPHAFTVGDVETAAASLTLSGTSSNTTVVPNGNIVFGGSGASRTVTITPATGQSGSATITMTVSDGTGGTASDTFVLTVTAGNTPPTISDITDKTTNEDTATPAISFTVGDAETPAASLTLSGSSSNTALVPNANIVFGGSGASRTVTLTPAANQSGTATITLTVTDGGGANASDAFVLTVTAVNDVPTISDVTDKTTNEDTATAALGFTVGDVETAAASLTMSGTSSNTTVVPNANIVFGGSGASRTVTLTPALNQTGTATITLTVTDANSGTATDTFVLTVIAVNDAPTISDVTDKTTPQNTPSGPHAFTVGDVETAAASLTMSGTSSNTTLVPNANIVFGGSGSSRTVTITPATGQAGSATITMTVSDGTGGTASDTFVLTVTAGNTPPTISDITDKTTNEDTATPAISFTVGDAETPAASLTLSGSSSNTALLPNANIVFGGSGASRTVTLTPAANQSGTATITLTVTDGGGANASDAFVLTVTAVNDVPTISDVTDKTTNEDTATAALGFTVGDVETAAASLTLSGSSSNTALVPNANIVFGGSGASRTVTITPALNQSGTATITLTVTDANAGTASDTFVLTVTAVNDVPTISDVTDKSTALNTVSGPHTFTVGDVETAAASLTMSSSSSNTTLVPAANIELRGGGTTRTVTIIPALDQSGTTTITLTVSDGTGGTASDTFVLTVSANTAPTISDITDKTTNEDTATSALSFTVGDLETPVASLTLSGSSSNTALVPNANIVFGGSGASRTVTITPALNQSGTATITVTVTDGNGGTASDTFVLTVTAVNDVPTISDVIDQATNEDTATAALGFTVGDVETPAASLTLSGTSSNTTLVPNANIVFGGSGASRTVTLTPALNQLGTATITLTVTDGNAGTVSDTFVLTVTAVNDVPTISDVTDKTTPQNTPSGPHAFTIGDVETAAASLTVSGTSSNTTLVPNASIVFGGSGASRTVTITPALNQSGTATITLTVSDGTGGTASDTFVLTVTAVNIAPTISDITDKTTNEDTATPAVSFTVGDVETPAASLTVAGASSNTALVPLANIVFGGSGASRTVTVTPAANQSGAATITLTVTDLNGGTANDSFVLNVLPVNDVPTISNVTDKTTTQDTVSGPHAFTIGDVETAAASLTVSATSSNTTLVPVANIVFGGAGASRTVTITPALTQSGTSTITLTVNDGTGGTAGDSFVLTVTTRRAPVLVAAYGFDEGSGTTVADASGGSNTGSIDGATWAPAGRFGRALSFDGNDWVTVADTAALGLRTGMTLEAWVRPMTDVPADWRTVILKERTGGLAYSLYADTGEVRAPIGYVNIGGVDDLSAAGVTRLLLDTWTHLATTFDGTQLRIYVNGVQVGSRTVLGNIVASAGPLRFGGNSVWGEYFNGLIDEIRLYDGALTQAEIQADMDAPVEGGGANAPTISDVTDKTTNEDTATPAIGFTVGDVETPVASLTVAGTSSNTTLVPNANIVFGGSGASRTVTITPAPNQSGTATITLTVTDGSSATASDSFVLTVTPVNDVPTISDTTDKTTPQNTVSGPHTFTIGDVETAAASLTVTAASSNTTLVPVASIVFGGSGSSRTVTITPASNQTGAATITLTVSDGNGGTAADSFVLTVTPVNAAPTISDVTDKTTNEDTATPALSFTVGDAETPAASLTVAGSSSNTTLVPVANIVFGGSGSSRTATITPALNQTGTATITLTVSDGSGGSASDTFVLTVTAVNDVPTISDVTDKTTNEDTPTPALSVTVGDVETPAASLTLTAASSNTLLVPTANIVLGGSGASRTVTITPALNQLGTATITLTVA